MIELFPQPEPRKPSLLRVGKSEYQFPLAATEIHILNDRGQTLWETHREPNAGPIRWRGLDSDGQSVYIPFLFAA